MSALTALFLAASILLTPGVAVLAAGTATLQDDAVTVRFDEPLQNGAREVMRIYPSIKSELEQAFGWRIDFRPTVVLIKEGDTFQTMVGSDLIAAIAIPARSLIIIDYSRMGRHPFALGTTLKHELCHLLLHHSIREENLPRWLDEGVCQWASDGIAELILERHPSFVREAVLSGNLLPLSGLQTFPQEPQALLLAYEESRSIIHYIGASYGPAGVIGLLNSLKLGNDPEQATQMSFSIGLQELQKRWQRNLEGESGWLLFLSGNLYEILFFLAALITTYGSVRLLLRRRARRRETDEDEM